MQFRLLSLLALALFGATLFGCGSGSPARSTVPDCQGASKFCLVSCNLGCQVSGRCAVTEIAQNQPIILTFSQAVDPRSVTSATFSLKTPEGEPPAGRVIVDGSTVVFQPDIRLQGGVTTFGFRADETYVLTLPQGADGSPSIQSSSGDPLTRTVVCSLSVTQGLVDLDGQRPEGELIVPTATTEVPANTQIVVRFSEIIDIGPFQGGNTQTSPIIYQIRRTKREDPNDPTSALVCDPQADPIVLPGVPVASVNSSVPPTTDVSLQPAIALPNQVCVEVIITEGVRDLSGKPAVPTTFRFFTSDASQDPISISETFATDQRLDKIISAGTWGGGRAIPGGVGGSGVLGSFDWRHGVKQGNQEIYVWSTDDQTIPATSTLFGSSVMVLDGVFEFTDLTVPEDVVVIFRGSNPAIIKVCGKVDIQGQLRCDGQAPDPTYNAIGVLDPVNGWIQDPGQDGSLGGPGGAAGGKGAISCLGDGVNPTQYNGDLGENLIPPANSGYTSAIVAGTGGNGGRVFPTNGNRNIITFFLFNSITGMVAGGGSGGSFLSQGGAGVAVRTFTGVATDLGPDSPRSTAVGFVPKPVGVSVFDHFLVGGSGGGGGGSQPTNMTRSSVLVDLQPWNGGGGGCGGGGALGLRIGNSFVVGGTGVLSCSGGGGIQYLDRFAGPPSPGGGGSGGSLILQVDQLQNVVQQGTLAVAGGVGTTLSHTQFNGQPILAIGGDGGHGYIRMEAVGITDPSPLGTVVGPPQLGAENIGELEERDVRTAFTSRWRSSRQLFAPRFLHYTLTVREDGQQVVYSDDPEDPSAMPALPGGPVELWIQGGEVNAGSDALESDPGPWVNYVAPQEGSGNDLNDPFGNSGQPTFATGFRFMLIFDRSTVQEIIVEDFVVRFVP